MLRISAAPSGSPAVRDYRAHLQACSSAKPATVNSALAAVDDFYIRRGLGAALSQARRDPHAARRALDAKAQIRYVNAVQARLPAPRPSARAGPVLRRRADR